MISKDNLREILLDITMEAMENIWADLVDRNGIQNALESCDKETQADIKDSIRHEVHVAILRYVK
jgi:hypothetical protein